MNIINLYDNYNSYFTDELKAIFEQVSRIASKSNYRLYLIGGLVRDMLIATCVIESAAKQSKKMLFDNVTSVKFLDVDITIEGDAIEFAKILEKEVGAKIISVHKDFGTVKVEINGEKIDFASTRSEIYPKKGHLPVVKKIGCSLKEDVLRRDFTINSLAMSLNQSDFANLVDYVNGFEDLKSKKIKILHDKSFIDDPTRIIRALKYSTRLGFKLEEKTLKLQEEYLENINYDIGYKRVKQEIKKTFEQNSQEAFDKFIEFGIYKLIIPDFGLPPHTDPHPSMEGGVSIKTHLIEQLIKKYNPKYPWLVYFGVIICALHSSPSPQERSKNLDILQLTNYENDVIEVAKNLLDVKLQTDFEIYKAFCTQRIETLLIIAILGKEKEVCHYLDNLSKIKLHINGKDLINLGLSPSKSFGEIFDYVLKKKLENPLLSKEDELRFVKGYID